MADRAIGYVEVNEWRGSRYYNFWPKLRWLEGAGRWTLYERDECFLLTDGAVSCAPKALMNNMVLCISWEDDQKRGQKLQFRTAELAEHQIRPAEEAGFLPVFHMTDPDQFETGDVQVREHVTDDDRPEPVPFISVSDTDERPRQKGPVRLLLGDKAMLWGTGEREGELYGPGLMHYAEAAVGARPAKIGLPAPGTPGSEWQRLKEDARLWDVFHDAVLEEEYYEFPRYVFQYDLEPVPGQAEEAEAEVEDPPLLEPALEILAEEAALLLPQAVEMGRRELADYLVEAVKQYRPSPSYTRNEILSIAIALTQGLLTVFSGAPGAGKTSICTIFAQVLGLREAGRYAPVPVERGWTSKRDFIGYHNPLTGGIESANARLYDGLRAASEEAEPAAPLLVLLDEANLSPMEYYWSDFMGIAGGDEDEAEWSIDLGGRDGELPISKACRFAATINNDHTTEELSPRIVDRAAVVALPSGEFLPGRKLSREDHYDLIAWSSLQGAFGGDEQALDGPAGEVYQRLKEKLSARPLGVAVSFRAEKAVRRFWNAARQEGVFEGDEAARDMAALDYAAAQRLLPKLSGSGRAFRDALEELRELCAETGLDKCAGILEDIVKRGGEDESALNYYSFF